MMLVLVHLGVSQLAAQELGSFAVAPGAAPLPLSQAWDTSYVVLLEANPVYRSASAEARQAVLQKHLQYQLRLIAEGRTVMGGPLVRAEGAPLVGITVLRARSAVEAETIAHADPGVSEGLMRARVRTWTTPAAGTVQTSAATTARDSIIAVVNEFFHAMTANDVAASERILLPGGVGLSTGQAQDGPWMRREANEEYLVWLAGNEDVMVERIRDPTVQVHGAIATLWAPYDFYTNGEFTHCGVNAVQLIRTDEGWRIANWIWTVEPDGCAPVPSGTPA